MHCGGAGAAWYPLLAALSGDSADWPLMRGAESL